ncbi:MAG: porin [Rhodobacterales bacterium]
MKKILIATTALVATTGVAVADVKLSGYARFGAEYNDSAAPGEDDVTTASRLRIQFDATTETDGGLTLGVRQRFQTEENNRNAGGNGARFFATGGGLTIAMGNIIGVIEAAPNLYLPTKSAGMGLEGNGFRSLATNTLSNDFDTFYGFKWTAYSSGGAGAREGVEVSYSMDGIRLDAHSTDASWALGASYRFADYTVAVAYEEWDSGARDGDSILFLSAGGKFGAFDAAISYADTDYGGVGSEKVSLRAGYKVDDALYVYGFVADEDTVDTAYGLGASYGLGGGASVEGGWTSNQNGDNIVSAGIFFSF